MDKSEVNKDNGNHFAFTSTGPAVWILLHVNPRNSNVGPE